MNCDYFYDHVEWREREREEFNVEQALHRIALNASAITALHSTLDNFTE